MSEPESDHQEFPAGISQGTALENEQCLYSDRRAWKNAHPLQNDETGGTNASKDPDEHNRYHGDLFEKQPRAVGHKAFALGFPLFTFTLPSLASSAITQACTWLSITRRNLTRSRNVSSNWPRFAPLLNSSGAL